MKFYKLPRLVTHIYPAVLSCLLAQSALAVVFSGNARVEVADPNGALSWKTESGALTISCWLKIAVPTSVTLTENMTVLVDRRTGSEADALAFLIRLNISNGNLEYYCKGASGAYVNTLIEKPYLDRWYHVAVVRQAETFTAYVDGRQVFSGSGAVGNAGNTNGISIGGWGNGKYFYGEIQEVAIYQTALSRQFIINYMFQDQPVGQATLMGYFKLGYSTNTADNLKNFATTPVPPGTEMAAKQGSGTLEFEETNQAGEQSAFDAQRNGGRDALAPLSGAFSWEQTALARPTPGIAFDFRFGYSSANAFGGYKLGSTDPYGAGPMGPGWRHNFQTAIIPAQDFSPLANVNVLGLMLWNGAIQTWDRVPNTYEYRSRDKEYKGELLMTLTNVQWTTPERLVYTFRLPDDPNPVMSGRLESIRDFNSNSVQILWDQITGVITQVVDSAGGRYNFNYDRRILLTNISFGTWNVNFAYDANNRLTNKTISGPPSYTNLNTSWTFSYNSTNGLLERITDPRGNPAVSVNYDRYGRKIAVADALNRITTTEYGVPGKRQIRHADPAGFKWVETYDRKGRVLAQQDPLGNITSYAYDEFGNRIRITEPLGWTTTLGYDSRGNVIARTNALGEVTRWVFHPFFNKAVQEVNPLNWTNYFAYDDRGNLTNHFDDLGSLVRYTYSSNGLVLTSTDANSNTTLFAYDTNGFLIATTDPLTNTTRRGVNELGWPLTTTNALGEVSTFTYDLNGNVVRSVDSLQRVYLHSYDPNGNLLSESDGKRGAAKKFTLYAYDAANQRTQMVDRAGNVWRYTYTTRGKLERVTDPLANVTITAYDAANRVLSVTDPAGNSVTNIYDANGNLTVLIDKLNQRWARFYDRLNRVTAESDPLGNTRRTEYDPAGRIAKTITPNGYPSVNTYDGRGRLIKWSDPEGYEWRYDYDGNANITNITDALGGRYVMTYDPRNARTLEKNQDGFQWRYEYDRLGRLAKQTDPNGTARTAGYDAGGRIVEVTFNTGRINSFVYDENNNATLLSRAGSGPATSSQLRYDALDRVIEHVDTFGNRISYTYDPLGRVSTLTYPDGKVLTNRYDSLGRLTNQVDWAGRQMVYLYDKADRLIARIYPNGVSQTNTLDNAGRITALTYQAQSGTNASAIQIAISYAYDRNGNKVHSTERGTLIWPLPSLKDEQARYTPAGRIIDRKIASLDNPLNVATLKYSYDPSGNMTNAVGGGQTYALTYDEDNRVTSFNWDCGLTSKINTNRYDAFGRRVARTIDGNEIRFVLDLATDMERVLCDVTPFGEITAWYVHGLDLCYKVDATETLTCYHSDAQANIIAITATGGTNLVRYAYTPYGRSLGESNDSTNRLIALVQNPYRFSGAQGVMEDLPNVYFMRARYYSAEAGVFLSTDPVKHIGPGWQPIHYAYASGNPLSYSDPKGEFLNVVAGAVGGALVGGGVELGSQFIGNLLSGKDVFDPHNYDGAKIAGAAVSGAIRGAVASTGVGAALLANPASAAAISAITSGASTLTENIINGNDLEEGLSESIVRGAAIGFLSSKINIGNKGQIYAGETRGAWGKSLASQVDFVSYSHPRNWLLQTGSQLVGEAIETRASLSSKTVTAANNATMLNITQSSKPASTCICSGTTSTQVKSSSSSFSSGSTAFSRITSSVQSAAAKAGNSITTTVQKVTSFVSTGVGKAINAIRSFFGGDKKK